MAEIKRGFSAIVVNIKILPAVYDGGQAGRTAGGAQRRNERFDPEDTSATSLDGVMQRPLPSWKRYCTAISAPSTNCTVLYGRFTVWNGIYLHK